MVSVRQNGEREGGRLALLPCGAQSERARQAMLACRGTYVARVAQNAVDRADREAVAAIGALGVVAAADAADGDDDDGDHEGAA